MNRFSQLEFDEKGDEGGQPVSRGEPVRDENYFHQRALAFWLAGDFENALRNDSRAVEARSNFLPGWVDQVWMLIELGEYPEAMLWADKALELFPEQPELLAAKSLACLRDAKLDKAQAFSDNATSKENVTAEVWLARAELLLAQKNNLAENCIRTAISIAGPMIGYVKLKAGRILRKYNKPSAAKEYLDVAVRVFPKSALAWYELGCCLSKLGFHEARGVLEQVVALRPGWNEAEEALNRCRKPGFFSRLFKKT
jgi:tetratricopeptide (TPR) repeat protein